MSVNVKTSWRRGLLNDIATSNEVAEELQVYGERVLNAARAAAPVKSGAYAASLHGVTERHRDRVAVHVVTDDPGGPTIEARHHVLGTALESL